MSYLLNRLIRCFVLILFVLTMPIAFGKTVSVAKDDLDVGDLIFEDGFVYKVTSIYPREVELTYADDTDKNFKEHLSIDDWVMDDYMNEYTVTAIQDYAFSGTKVKTVAIEDIDIIGEDAFRNCKKLKEVYIAGGVKTIDTSTSFLN